MRDVEILKISVTVPLRSIFIMRAFIRIFDYLSGCSFIVNFLLRKLGAEALLMSIYRNRTSLSSIMPLVPCE